MKANYKGYIVRKDKYRFQALNHFYKTLEEATAAIDAKVGGSL